MAAPFTVCAASFSAIGRGNPALTPPSASASIKRYTYAGPLPLTAVTASMSLGSTLITSPTAPNKVSANARSSAASESPDSNTIMPSPIIAGVFGITLSTRAVAGRAFFSRSPPHPPAIDITALLEKRSNCSSNKCEHTFGFTAISSRSLFSIRLASDSAMDTPKSRSNARHFSISGSKTVVLSPEA